MGIGSLILYLIGLIFALILLLIFVGIIAAVVMVVGFFKEEIYEEKGFFHKVADKLGMFQ